ncbi:hypothetical protein LSTR_LSTR008077 [Laodelphax striatellus]|uniref:Protein odr-4 homolog n=1 Tax=Laodelphax striatellus TaxID=195883 RepID=A0A482X7I3_LAOST|nr:hypothetical protein LSTR_LSTR008077 [Laodelphax striatellus]
MGRSVICEEKLLGDLIKLSKTNGFTSGLILGQSSGAKDFVVHLARTPLQLTIEPDAKDNSSLKETPKTWNNVTDIEEKELVEHAKQVTWMLPGGMWVLGIFTIGPGDLFNEALAPSKLKSVLTKLTKCLSVDNYKYGNSPSTEKLAFHLNSDSKKYSCRCLDLSQPQASQTFRPVDWKFQSNCTKWLQVDCHYDFEQLSPHLITDSNSTPMVKKLLKEILDQSSIMISKAVCTIDGEIRNGTDSLEVTDKKKKGKTSGNKSTKEEKTFEVNLYFQNEEVPNISDSLQVVDTTGELRCVGSLSCRVYLHQKASVEEAVKAIKEDIIRSLSSRLEMHWDSLVEDEVESPDELVVLHEPPRRVLIPLPYCKVAFSDYLFPGEDASETLDSLQLLLGLKLNESSLLKDFEGQSDPNQYYELNRHSSSYERNKPRILKDSQVNSQLIITGMIIAALILFTSVLIQLTGWPLSIFRS